LKEGAYEDVQVPFKQVSEEETEVETLGDEFIPFG
jgi:hypothetical protein